MGFGNTEPQPQTALKHMNRNFFEFLRARHAKGLRVCVGLDSDINKIPKSVNEIGWEYIEKIVDFNNKIIDATKDLVCAYKPNSAFYEAHGAEGMRALRHTIENIHLIAPAVPVILDAKRGDIGESNLGYVKSAFDFLGADAITVHPYMGRESLQPFLDQKNKGIFAPCRTSNPGAGEFQNLEVRVWEPNYERAPGPSATVPLYQIVAENVARRWNENGNCGLVVGATAPEELAEVRKIIGPDMTI